LTALYDYDCPWEGVERAVRRFCGEQGVKFQVRGNVWRLVKPDVAKSAAVSAV
jgi:hypothetical protein